MKRFLLLFFIVLTAFSPPVSAASPAKEKTPLKLTVKPYSNLHQSERGVARLLSGVEAIKPGEPFWVALLMELEPGWHTYTDPPGDAGLATEMKWTLPKGFTAGKIEWPKPTTFKEGTLTTYGYHDRLHLPVQITPPQKLTAKKDYVIKLKAGWLLCKEICIPEENEFILTLPALDAKAEAKPSAYEKRIEYVVKTREPGLPAKQMAATVPAAGKPEVNNATGAQNTLPKINLLVALFFALAGGLILNLMPCVFPVLSLKCLAVARSAALDRRDAAMEGLAYLAGILVCFAIVSITLIALQKGGEAIGWGFQMQSPVFVTAMAFTLFIVGLNLSGLFTLPSLFANTGAELAAEPSVKGSFFTGVLAALVATPCTAPLMAPALGYALTQPAGIAFFIFQCVGIGLALPFLLVSFYPQLLKKLPQPGPWMERLKDFLALPMYASAAWLLWVLMQQVGMDGVAAAAIAMVMIGAALWRLRGLAVLAVVALLAVGTLYYVRTLPTMQISQLVQEAEPFNQARLNALRAEGRPVFVDATAAWCITCRVNHYSSLTNAEVQAAFKAKGVVMMVADWTNRNPDITRYLASFGYNGVPLYVYYPPRGNPKVLPQVLTPRIVTDAIK